MEQARPAVQNAMQRMDKGVAEGPYEADWESLKTYPVPEWLREADDAARTVEARFRITGRRPKPWDPVTGETRGLPEDVELGIYPKDGGIGHAITLTGLCWEDKDGDKIWDPGEQPSRILYADPNQTDWTVPMEGSVNITGGRIEFTQGNETWYIDHAWPESPVPEPASVIVWSVLAILGMTVTWRQRTDRGCGS